MGNRAPLRFATCRFSAGFTPMYQTRALKRVFPVAVAGLACVLTLPSPATAQDNLQLWGSFSLGWSGRESVGYEVEIEPKVLVVVPEREPDWASIDITPSVDRAVKPWLDLVGELATGYTSQTDQVNSFELSPRAGARFHLFSRDLSARVRLPDRPSKRRVVFGSLM